MAKAQMFIITVIFLVGLVFSVQQLAFQYSSLDLSAPFRENSIYLLRNTEDVINKTIKTTTDCQDFSVNMKELKDFLDRKIPREGYSLSLSYSLDCSYWGNSPPESAPLNFTIRILGNGEDTSARSFLYHN